MISLIPQPRQLNLSDGTGDSFQLPQRPQVRLAMEHDDPRLSRHLARAFPALELEENRSASGWQLVINGAAYQVEKAAGDDSLPPHPAGQPEGYRLDITAAQASIVSAGPAGLFYGLQTLLQLLELGTEGGVPPLTVTDWPDTALRCMNYDLRQTHSRPERLISYLSEFARTKINGLLVEYEDKFPFQSYPELVHPKHALTSAQLAELLETAHEYYIEVIPLQQSFGHLEYVLRYDQYKHLRETETSTGELCPSQAASYELVTGLLEEIINRHPDARYVHLGCDEVYSLCECPVCIERFDGIRERAFIAFLNQLIGFVAARGKTPIFWHDMLDKCPAEELERLDRRSAAMIWIYNGRNIVRDVSQLTDKFRRLGIQVMGGPSVRSFDWAEHQNYPVLVNRVDNLVQWAEVSETLDLDCIVGTNWTGPFSLGVPYGIFESTWYPMLLHAELSWNRKADTNSFMTRFMGVFHGIPQETLEKELGRYRIEDYYDSIWKVLDHVQRHREEAELIDVMHAYEVATDRSRAIHKYLYRWELFPGDSAEWRSLLNNYQRNRRKREQTKPRMQALLELYQTPEMADHFVRSRYYLHEYLERTIYQDIGLHLEEQPV
ncbi:glycoside hydrolase family 20 zincin-like fold domain-containing protein [Paenibacillus daejeonensis]|uniref:glycoside hydrolase family 20 zincin-like fold domain-containing protein n=1 Tax=Paenibacillus daejeonensis TaxID=135193 RepID=UPI000379F36B|nr:glycoside hydrolase family 20 zincin-like fold domain-containing protein [Paenibacillus daejeonensis]